MLQGVHPSVLEKQPHVELFFSPMSRCFPYEHPDVGLVPPSSIESSVPHNIDAWNTSQSPRNGDEQSHLGPRTPECSASFLLPGSAAAVLFLGL